MTYIIKQEAETNTRCCAQTNSGHNKACNIQNTTNSKFINTTGIQ